MMSTTRKEKKGLQSRKPSNSTILELISKKKKKSLQASNPQFSRFSQIFVDLVGLQLIFGSCPLFGQRQSSAALSLF